MQEQVLMSYSWPNGRTVGLVRVQLDNGKIYFNITDVGGAVAFTQYDVARKYWDMVVHGVRLYVPKTIA